MFFAISTTPTSCMRLTMRELMDKLGLWRPQDERATALAD
jgi:hypothetical protein